MKNQAYFRRNYMPGMLGWFSMRAETSREDIEWMLARSAAFDAGYAFYTSFEALEANGQTDEILAMVGRWEKARMAGAFTVDQKKRLEDVSGEFHLEEHSPVAWSLTPISVTRLEAAQRQRQPGEPAYVSARFENGGGEQPAGFILTATGGTVSGVLIEIDGRPVRFDVSLTDGQHLVYRGGAEATVVSATWKPERTVPVETGRMTVGPGTHQVRFEAAVAGTAEARAKLEIRLNGTPEPVGGR